MNNEKLICPKNDDSGNPCNSELKITDVFKPEGSKRKFQRYECPKCKYLTCTPV